MSLNKNVKFLRKIIVLLLVTHAAAAYAQDEKISLRKGEISVGEAIRSIEEQTSYRFSYNKNLCDTAKMINLAGSRLSLNEILGDMADDANVKYMVRGRNIILAPSNDKPRPRPEVPLTSDVYVRNHPNDMSAAPVSRPVVEKASTVSPAKPEPAAMPEKEQYSDYRPIDIYGNVQRSLPRFGIKINLLYGLATLTPNLSIEVALSRRSTLELSYSSNPWKYKADLNDNKKLLHGIASLEYRYWLCERYSGHFFGVHGLYSEYNISSYDIPILFKKEYRYRGNAWGGGVLYGYALPIGKMWNIEFTAGVDVLRMGYNRYDCQTCSRNSEPFKKTHLVPSAGINVVFLIR